MIAELWAFSGLMLMGQFSPGPDMLILTRTSLAEGPKTGCLMASGIATGLVVHSILAISGVAVVFSRGGSAALVSAAARAPLTSSPQAFSPIHLELSAP